MRKWAVVILWAVALSGAGGGVARAAEASKLPASAPSRATTAPTATAADLSTPKAAAKSLF